MPNRGRIVGAFFLAGLLLLPVSSSVGVESRSEKAAQGAGKKEAEIQQRRSEVEAFKQNLKNAETPEEKQALVEDFREQNQARLEQLRAKRPRTKSPSRSPAEMVAKMKQDAAGNPEALKRVEEIETRIAGNEQVKLQLERIRQADGEEKQELVEKLREERANQLKARELERETRKQSRKNSSRDQEIRPLPPGAQARLAVMEEQREAVERVQEKMKTGDADQRREAVEELRELKKERREELQKLRSQRERTNRSQSAKGTTRS